MDQAFAAPNPAPLHPSTSARPSLKSTFFTDDKLRQLGVRRLVVACLNPQTVTRRQSAQTTTRMRLRFRHLLGAWSLARGKLSSGPDQGQTPDNDPLFPPKRARRRTSTLNETLGGTGRRFDVTKIVVNEHQHHCAFHEQSHLACSLAW
jgi:hypothetical protein